MSILTSLVEKVNPYALWIKLGVLALGAIFAATGGYKLGVAIQKGRNDGSLTACLGALNATQQSLLQAQERGRQAAAAAYEDEIKALQEQNRQTTMALGEYQKTNAALAAKNQNFQNTIQGLRHEKSNAEFLDTPLPAAVRDGVLAGYEAKSN